MTVGVISIHSDNSSYRFQKVIEYHESPFGVHICSYREVRDEIIRYFVSNSVEPKNSNELLHYVEWGVIPCVRQALTSSVMSELKWEGVQYILSSAR